MSTHGVLLLALGVWIVDRPRQVCRVDALVGSAAQSSTHSFTSTYWSSSLVACIYKVMTKRQRISVRCDDED